MRDPFDVTVEYYALDPYTTSYQQGEFRSASEHHNGKTFDSRQDFEAFRRRMEEEGWHFDFEELGTYVTPGSDSAEPGWRVDRIRATYVGKQEATQPTS